MVPRVTIGLPVRNGADFVSQAIESILAQSFREFELIISDNASTDNTEEICRRYMGQDERISYVRYDRNVGAARNHNRLLEMAHGEFFKWAAHDDLIAPEYLARCVEVLDRDGSVVVCHARTKEIDEHGTVLKEYPPLDVGSDKSSERFRQCVCVPHSQDVIFGVIRTDALRKTRLFGVYSSSDRVLLGELALLGRFYEVPEFLFFKRDHPQAHWHVYPTRHCRIAWYDPAKAGAITFPHWRLLREHWAAVMRTPMHRYERLRCFGHLGRWIRAYDGPLARELLLREG